MGLRATLTVPLLIAAIGSLAAACADGPPTSVTDVSAPSFSHKPGHNPGGGGGGPPAGDPAIKIEFRDVADNIRSDNHATFGRVYDDGVCNVDATFNVGDARLFLKGKINKKERATCGDPRRIQVDFSDPVDGSQSGGTVEATFFKVDGVEQVTELEGTVLQTAVIGGAGCAHQLPFDPVADDESDAVEVTQNTNGTWTVRTQPYPDNVAVCIPDETKANPPPRSYYHMPFEVTVTLK